MKKTLFILATMVAAAIAAEASTVLISFGINSNSGTAVVDGTYFGETGQKVNTISISGSSGVNSASLVTTGGASSGISLTTNGGCCGAPGVMTDSSAKASALGTSDKFYGVFGADMSLGNSMGGVLNSSNDISMQMSGLSMGTYTLTILAGRGNSFNGGISTYSIGGDGIGNISASLDDYSVDSGASRNGTSISANTDNGKWVLMTYTFEVTADNTTLNINSSGAQGNINCLALASVPEPATASLGLLGLGALLMRRRRA